MIWAAVAVLNRLRGEVLTNVFCSGSGELSKVILSVLFVPLGKDLVKYRRQSAWLDFVSASQTFMKQLSAFGGCTVDSLIWS
jgi:hypothetical protein